MTERRPKPYYLVAIPEGKGQKKLLQLQKFLSRRFRMYRPPYPSLHLTVGIIDGNEVQSKAAFSRLVQAAGTILPLTVQLHGCRCFGPPHLAVGVGVRSRELALLAGKVEGFLFREGYSVRPFDRWLFHISLVNPLFARRTWTWPEYQEACRIVANHAPDTSCVLRRLELWDPDFPPLKVLARFPPGSPP